MPFTSIDLYYLTPYANIATLEDAPPAYTQLRKLLLIELPDLSFSLPAHRYPFELLRHFCDIPSNVFATMRRVDQVA